MSNKILIIFISILVPILTVLGVCIDNTYNMNQLTMLALALVSIFPIMIIVSKSSMSNSIYPIAIYSIALSLLLHVSLTGSFINGADIQTEYFMADNVIETAHWEQNIANNVNSMLSIVMIAPMSSLLLGLDLAWTFKIVYPVAFSLVPVILFYIYKKIFDIRLSFLSVIIFMFTPFFFLNMPFHARVQIVELLVVLLIFSITYVERLTSPMRLIGITLLFGIVVSHYGMAYLFLFLMVLSFLVQHFFSRLFSAFDSHIKFNTLSVYLAIYIVFLISWYIYTSNGQPFLTVVNIFSGISNSIFNDLLNPYSRDIMSLATREEFSPIRSIVKWSNGAIILSIIIGFVVVFFNQKKFNFDKNFFIFSMGSITMLGASIAVPSFSSNLSFERLYQIQLIFLAPFAIIGLMTIFRSKNIQQFALVTSIILSIFLLFNVGIVSEMVHDNFPINIALNRSVPTTSYSYYTQNDVVATKWLNRYGADDGKYFGSLFQGYFIMGAFMTKDMYVFDAATNDTCYDGTSYILVTNKETIYDQIVSSRSEKADEDKKFLATTVSFRDSSFSRTLSNTEKIYDTYVSNVNFCKKY